MSMNKKLTDNWPGASDFEIPRTLISKAAYYPNPDKDTERTDTETKKLEDEFYDVYRLALEVLRRLI